MNAGKLREELSKHDDFRDTKTLLQEKIESRGHLCMYFPKFHCELNAIERCWCHAKKYSRAHANGTITRLRTIVPKALDTCTIISKFFCTCRDYMKAWMRATLVRMWMKQLNPTEGYSIYYFLNIHFCTGQGRSFVYLVVLILKEKSVGV